MSDPGTGGHLPRGRGVDAVHTDQEASPGSDGWDSRSSEPSPRLDCPGLGAFPTSVLRPHCRPCWPELQGSGRGGVLSFPDNAPMQVRKVTQKTAPLTKGAQPVVTEH